MIGMLRLANFNNTRHANQGRTRSLNVKFKSLGKTINVSLFRGNGVTMHTVNVNLTEDRRRDVASVTEDIIRPVTRDKD